ncbi:MAG: hypothetical protein J7L66_04010, partial [Anaerolineaceae bacterium]|nr:hypothetical protein [Anaerolineaceae bacterium]
DVWVNGKSVPFCFGMDGGYRQYAKIGRNILEGDAGNYLIPIPKEMPYAAGAITEPWACVEASYRISFRNCLKNRGSVLFCGCENSRLGFNVDGLWKKDYQPNKVTVSNIPDDLQLKINAYCKEYHIEMIKLPFREVMDLDEKYDDILTLDCPANIINSLSKKLGKGSIFAICNEDPLEEQIEVDMGNLHYDNIVYVGTTSLNISEAFQSHPIRANLQPGGNAWFLGAGGPMGRMHVQRAIELNKKPKRIFATNRGLKRLRALRDSFSNLAQEKRVEFAAYSPTEEEEEYGLFIKKVYSEGGFDDIVVLVANPKVVEDAVPYLAKGGVLNLFAGVNRGVKARIDAWNIYGPRQIRLIGYSGSGLDDQRMVVEKAISGELMPEKSVAVVGGFTQIPDGIRAMQSKLYPGKIVIYPHVLNYPLTLLEEFREKDREIYDVLGDGKTWTAEAEAIFLEKGLK